MVRALGSKYSRSKRSYGVVIACMRGGCYPDLRLQGYAITRDNPEAT